MNELFGFVKHTILGNLTDAEAVDHRRFVKAVTDGWAGVGDNPAARRASLSINELTYSDLMSSNGRQNRHALLKGSLRQYADQDAKRTAKIFDMAYFASVKGQSSTAKDADSIVERERVVLGMAGAKRTVEDQNRPLPQEYLAASEHQLGMFRFVVDAMVDRLAVFDAVIDDPTIMKTITSYYQAQFRHMKTEDMPKHIEALEAIPPETVPDRFAFYHREMVGKVVPILKLDYQSRLDSDKAAAEKQRIEDEKKQEDDRRAAELAEEARLKRVIRQRTFDLIIGGTLEVGPSYWQAPTDIEARQILSNLATAMEQAKQIVVSSNHFGGGGASYTCTRAVSTLGSESISALRSLIIADRLGLNWNRSQFGQSWMRPEILVAYLTAINTDGRAEIGIREDGGRGSFYNLAARYPAVFQKFIGDPRWIAREAEQRLEPLVKKGGVYRAAAYWAIYGVEG
jgi:hypothetical protein